MLLKGNVLYIDDEKVATLKGGRVIYEGCYCEEQVPMWALYKVLPLLAKVL